MKVNELTSLMATLSMMLDWYILLRWSGKVALTYMVGFSSQKGRK